MSIKLMALVALIYLYVCADMFMQRKYGTALAYFCWGFANVGLIWAMKQGI